jgi:hypothetical protein
VDFTTLGAGGQVTVTGDVEGTACSSTTINIAPPPTCTCSVDLSGAVVVAGASTSSTIAVTNDDPYWECPFDVVVEKEPISQADISADFTADGVADTSYTLPSSIPKATTVSVIFDYLVNSDTSAEYDYEEVQGTATSPGLTVDGTFYAGGQCVDDTPHVSIIPSGETAIFDAWGYTPPGAALPQATLSAWGGSLTPQKASSPQGFYQRTVREREVSTWDDCHTDAVAALYTPTCDPFHLTQAISQWSVDSNNEYRTDVIGIVELCVSEYRTFGVTPCGMGAEQEMTMPCENEGGVVGFKPYTSGAITINIDSADVRISRQGSNEEVLTWP